MTTRPKQISAKRQWFAPYVFGYFETWAEIVAYYGWPLNVMRGRPDAGEQARQKQGEFNKWKCPCEKSALRSQWKKDIQSCTRSFWTSTKQCFLPSFRFCGIIYGCKSLRQQEKRKSSFDKTHHLFVFTRLCIIKHTQLVTSRTVKVIPETCENKSFCAISNILNRMKPNKSFLLLLKIDGKQHKKGSVDNTKVNNSLLTSICLQRIKG